MFYVLLVIILIQFYAIMFLSRKWQTAKEVANTVARCYVAIRNADKND